MPAPIEHPAHDYAERIRERLPRRLQELRESERLSMYALWQKCDVSRDTISRIEGGERLQFNKLVLLVMADRAAMR